MALYGSSLYGTIKYGTGLSNLTLFTYDANFKAVQNDYGIIDLSWSNVTIGVTADDTALTNWKVIKTVGGAPDYPNTFTPNVIYGTAALSSGKTYALNYATSDGNTLSRSYTFTENFFPGGTEVTYSLWVFNGTRWVFCGSSDCLIVGTTDTASKLMGLLPAAWTNTSGGIAEVTGYANQYKTDTTDAVDTDLWKFISGFGFYYDKLRTETELLNTMSDYRHFPYKLLPAAIDTLGMQYSQQTGTSYLRSLYKAGNMINSLKGTQLGLISYAEALTSSQAQIYWSTNLFADYNDSSFEESIGSWLPNNTNTFVAKKYSNAVADLGGGYSGLTVPLKTGAMIGKTLRSIGYGLVTASGTTDIILTSYNPPSYALDTVTASTPKTGYVQFTTKTPTKYRDGAYINISGIATTTAYNGYYNAAMLDSSTFYVKSTTTGTANTTNAKVSAGVSAPTITRSIPVTPGKAYIFTGNIQRHSSNTGTSATVSAQIVWFDNQGYSIVPATSYGSTVTPSTSWKSFWSSPLDSNTVAPANAAYAGVNIKISGQDSTDRFLMDMFSFTELTDTRLNSIEYIPIESMYEDARTVTVEIRGSRTNLLTNPGFSEGVGSWNPRTGTLIQDFTTSVYGSNSAKFTASGSTASVSSNWVQVLPNSDYTFSVYLKAGASGKSAKIAIEYHLPTDALDQTSLNTQSTFVYYPTSTNKTYSNATSVSNTGWTRLNITATSPNFSSNVGMPLAKVSIEPVSSTNGDVWYIDAALLEKSTRVLSYFQGDGGPTPSNIYTDMHIPAGDCSWETRPRANFISNPSFDNGTTYYSTSSSSTGSSATLTAITGETVSSIAFTPRFSGGAEKFGKIATNSSTATSTITSTFNYPYITTNSSGIPNMPAGGESFSASAYVTSAVAGYYQITFTDTITGTSYSNSFTINTASNNWYRIHVTGYVGKPTTTTPSGSVSVSFTPANPPAAIAWYIDGIQAEYGSEPTSFIDPNVSSTTAVTNRVTSKDQYGSSAQMSGVGRSYYWPNYATKLSRLINTVANYLPAGASYAIQVGERTDPVKEIISSIATANSFENNLQNWHPAGTTVLSRQQGRGSLYSETGAGSVSWAKATNSVSGEASFGLYQDSIPCSPGVNYNISAAINFPTTADLGLISFDVNWYDVNGADAYNYDSSGIKISGSNLVSVTIGAFTTINRWYYAFSKTLLTAPPTAYSAKLTIQNTPTTGRTGTNSILVDSVTFEEV